MMSCISPKLRMLFLFFGLTAILPLCAEQAQAQDDVGLQYLFREAVLNESPWGLKKDDFGQLSEDWQAWSDKTQQLLTSLYDFEPLSMEQQATLLEDLDHQLDTVYGALHDPDQRENHPGLVDLEGKIYRRLEIYGSMLELFQEDVPKLDELKPLLVQLLQALERYESDDRNVDISLKDERPLTTPQILMEMDQIAGEQVAALTNQVRIHYFNFNFRTFVSEPFADFAFYQCRKECGPVCDFILGARVTGSQRTKSGVYIDFLPSTEAAKFAIRINGNTKTNTRGVTDQATVFTSGNHYFTGKKLMMYDGYRFKAYPASLGVNANNHVKGAQLNRRTIIAKIIGDKIAYDRAVEKTPETERIAASRLRGRILPRFNNEIEETFGDLNDRNEGLRERMTEYQIAPNEVLARTDHDELRTAERLINPGQLAADRATTVFNSPTGLTVHIHESWINNSLAFDSLDLEAGMELPFQEFAEILSEKFIEVFNIDREVKKLEETADRVITYAVDPLHVQFESGLIKIIFRIGLKVADYENTIAIRRVEIPLQLTLVDDQIKLSVDLERGSDAVPLDTTDKNYRRREGAFENKFMPNRLSERIQERLNEVSLSRSFVIEADDNGGKDIPVKIDQIHSVNGWLILVMEPDED